MKESSHTVFHALSKEEAASVMETNSASGLDTAEVDQRLQEYGPNSITGQKKVSLALILLNQFKSPIVFLLLFAAGLSFWFEEWLDAVAILVVIGINGIIGFYMEYKAEKSMQALKKLSMVNSRVIRKKQLIEIPSENMVPGDIAFVEAGDLVAADGRIFNLSQLQADESALTGESAPVEKQTGALPAETVLAERSNMLYKGTHISKGNGYLIVTATGMNTELGKVASLVQTAKPAISPLEKKLEDFTKKLIKVTLGLVALVFIAGILNGQDVIKILSTSIALAVAAIPEGLPIVATMALAQGMIKMARHNVIVKKLSAVETLGGTNVICTDKTGTLTKNKIEVKDIFPASPQAEELIKNASILCNTAEWYSEAGEIKELGDPLETGLLKYFGKDPEAIGSVRARFPKIKEEPFSSETKIMATLHEAGKEHWVFAKGAAEELLEHCSHILNAEGEIKLNDETRQHWLKEAETHASQGMRVIGTAYKKSKAEEANLCADLVFIGLIGMIDPPREEVFDAIKECHSAGIQVIMITGDHPATARTIARELNIADSEKAEVMVGKDMKEYSELSHTDKSQWINTPVFARVSPQQKLDLVQVLQERNYVVGMTGDGINDAPALKKADIGIAMGQRGTQVAQEVADMVIKDDSFSSIVLAIKEGRVIFENIRKFVIFLLSCNLTELMVIATAAVFNLQFQLFPLQILFINIITDVLPALALGITPAGPGIMKLRPRNEAEPIIDKQRWWAIIFYSIVKSAAAMAAVSISQVTMYKNGQASHDQGNNILFFTLIISQLLHVLNMNNTGTSFFRSEVFRNKYVWYSLIVSVMLVILAYLVEPARKALAVSDMAPGDWLVCILASMGSVLVIQVAKKMRLVKQ